MKKMYVVLLAAAIGLMMVLTGCGKSAEAGGKETDIQPVKEQQEKLQNVEAFGIVKARDIQNITIDFPATVKEVMVQEGQRVRMGDPIMALDISAYQGEISAKEKEISIAELELQKIEKEKTNYINTKTIKNLSIKAQKERIALLKNDLDMMKGKLQQDYMKENNILSNASDGVIYDIGYYPGDIVNSGKKAFSIMSWDNLYITADVPEEFIKDVQMGAAVTIIPVSDKSKIYKGSVISISNNAIRQNNETIIPVEISIDDRDEFLKPNYNVDVEISAVPVK